MCVHVCVCVSVRADSHCSEELWVSVCMCNDKWYLCVCVCVCVCVWLSAAPLSGGGEEEEEEGGREAALMVAFVHRPSCSLLVTDFFTVFKTI